MATGDCLEISLFYPVEAVNGGLFVSTGSWIHPTRLLSSYELVFVAEGELHLFEEDRTFAVGENEALILFPGRRHGGVKIYPGGLSFYWAHFNLLEDTAAAANACIRSNQLTTLVRPERMIELFRRFIDDQESGLQQPLSASHNVALMLCELAHTAETERQEQDTETVLSERINSYIAQHFHEQISTSQIATRLGYNADYLERVFRRERHTSITAAIHHCRIKEARAQLLNCGYKNINQIAFDCGYADPGYFRRMFRRRTSMTPKEFRALYSRTHINTH